MAEPMMRTAVPGEVNYDPIDSWTLGHVAVGAAMGVVGLPFWSAAVFGVGWELVERPLRVRGLLFDMAPDNYSVQDTAVNSLCDALANMGGWWLGDMLRKAARK